MAANIPPAAAPAAAVLGLLGGAAYLVSESLYNVEGGYRAVIFSKISGVEQRSISEGTHFMIPFIERAVIFDCRARARNYRSQTGSRDLQTVSVNLRLLARPDPNRVHTIYQSLGTNYDDKVLDSITHEVLKSVVAQYNATQLLNQRDQVSRNIRDRLVERARDFNILLDDVSLTEVTFSTEFTAATEAKQVAQQEAERAKFVVEKALQEKRSTILRAKADSESIIMMNETLRGKPGYLAIRQLEAARDIAHIISKSNNRVYLNADSLLLDVSKVEKFANTEAPKAPEPVAVAEPTKVIEVVRQEIVPQPTKSLDLVLYASVGALSGALVAALLGSR